MGITADGQLIPFLDPNLHHGRFGIEEILGGLDNLKHILAMNLLATLEALNHIIYKLERHFTPQSYSIVLILDADRVDIQILKRRRWIRHLDGLFELNLANKLLAFGQL